MYWFYEQIINDLKECKWLNNNISETFISSKEVNNIYLLPHYPKYIRSINQYPEDFRDFRFNYIIKEN